LQAATLAATILLARTTMSAKRGSYTRSPQVPPELLDRFAVVVATLGGTITVSDGARRLGLSRVQYQTVVHRALGAVVESLQPRPPGPRPEPEEVRKLRARVADLEQQLEAAQEQAAMFQRFMGVASDLLHGRAKLTGRAPRKPKAGSSSTSTTSTTSPDPDAEPDPAETRRREVLTWATRLRAVRVHPTLIVGLLGVSTSTLGRWRRRVEAGQCLRRRRPGPQTCPVDAGRAEAIESAIRMTKGLVGVESLRHTVGAGVSRRNIRRIKIEVVRTMERERIAACTRVDVTVPGIVRGFDAMEIRCAEGRRWALVCTDAAVPHRTTVALVDQYDADHVLEVLLHDFVRHGAPLVLRMDRAACQRTPEVCAILAEQAVLVLHGPPRCPWYYGQLERQNREHRAWLRGLEGAPEAVVCAALVQMQHALNGHWPRPSLDWRTAEQAWTARPIVSEDRPVLAEEVQTRAARLAAHDALDELAARRFAIEHSLRERGYLTLNVRSAC